MMRASPTGFLRHGLWGPVMLASVAPAAGPAPPAAIMPAGRYGMAEPVRDERLLRDVVLNLHNRERGALGLPALQWDDALARDAARYAAEMALTGRFRHSLRTTRAVPSGENLWMGPRRLYGYGVMIGTFLDERPLFRPGGKLPDISRNGRWQDVGHYTQMIWRGTRRVGCAVKEGADHDYLVCRYVPAGNVFGQGPLDAGDGAALATAPTLPSAPR